MAVIAQDQTLQQKGQNSQNPLQTIGTAAPATPAGNGTSAPATGSGNAQTGQSNAQPQGSGSFTNLQKYLTANKTGGQQIANGIQNNFNKQTSQIAQNVAAAQGSLQRNVDPLQQQLGTQGQQTIQQGFQNPDAVLADAGKTNDFTQLSNGYQQGIANVAGTQQLRQQQLAQQNQGLAGTAAQAGSESGRFQLLRNLAKTPAYGQGEQRLDQVLLGSQPGVTANLQANLNQGVNQNQQSINNLQNTTANQVNDLKGLSTDRQSQWTGLLNNGADNSGTAIDSNLQDRGLNDITLDSQNRFNAATQDANVDLPAIKARMAAGTATQADLDRFGIQNGLHTYDVDATKFLNTPVAPGTLTDTADANEVNRYNSLRKLSGQDAQGGSIFGDPANIGTYKGADFNNADFNKAVTGAQQKYQVGNVDQMIDQMTRSGMFGGRADSTGASGSFRSSDPGAEYRQRTGNLVTQVQQQHAAGQISDADYYNKILGALNQGWAGSGNTVASIAGQNGGLYADINNYGTNVLNPAQSHVLGTDTNKALPVTPGVNGAPATTNFTAIQNQLANSGYTIPTSKGGAPAVDPSTLIPDKKA